MHLINILETRALSMANTINTCQKMNLNFQNLCLWEPQLLLHAHWLKSKSSDDAQTFFFLKILLWWVITWNSAKMRSMIWIPRMDKEPAKDFWIRLRGFAKYLKLTVLIEVIVSNFPKLTKFCTRKEVYVI